MIDKVVQFFSNPSVIFVPVICLFLSGSALAQGGALDLTFGGDGKVVTLAGETYQADALAVRSVFTRSQIARRRDGRRFYQRRINRTEYFYGKADRL
jgi:hypothetical protein